MLALVAALAATCSAAAGGGACGSPLDCALAGTCTAGACKCDPWATGASCTLLNAGPAKTSKAFSRANSSSWGGSAVKGTDGQYHMYASSFIDHCGFGTWERNSEVIHSTASDPEGPYLSADVASPPWTHNPTMTLVNRTYVLYHLGAGHPNGSPKTDCSNGSTHGHGTGSRRTIVDDFVSAGAPPAPLMPAVSWSSSPAGPWQSLSGTRDGWGLNNPAAYFLPNGSVFMLYKAGCDEDPSGHSFCRQFAVANCVTFKGPCNHLRKIPIYGEDAGLFRDKRDNFHIFFHGGNYSPCRNTTCNYTGPTCRRFHHNAWSDNCYFHTAWSADGLDWHMDKTTNVFNWSIATVGGGSVTYADRARHQVLVDTNGELSHVFGGVRRDDVTDFTLTAVQPVHTSKTLSRHGEEE